ncbi:hypothetical protein HMI55_002738 [Coelomomyces lativittatus]|nr:hypothetical protein HMI55_002738 [Coelomomyces lativittatus]
MFEQVVANILNNVLGDYIDNLETNQLNIGIWAGDVVLKNLNLKKDALDKFDVPFSIVHGKIGGLTMKIPWNNLKGLPFRISIDNVSLLVKPRASMEFSNTEEDSRLLKIKKEQLLALETIHTSTVQLSTCSLMTFIYTIPIQL